METQLKKRLEEFDPGQREQLISALKFYIRYHMKPGDEQILRKVPELQKLL